MAATAYTSSRERFQQMMRWSLSGTEDEAAVFVKATVTDDFYQIVNGQRLAREHYLESIKEQRRKTQKYDPHVEEFLRDGKQLAARMIGTLEQEGTVCWFEAFLFGELEMNSGKLKSLVERVVWGPVSKDGANVNVSMWNPSGP